jgi:hypothetical protein
MRTKEDFERYLGLTGYAYELVGDGMWVVRLQPGDLPLIVNWTPPLVVFRLKILAMPAVRREEFLTMLLRLNASDLVHGAFGLEDDDVVLTFALQAENLDFNELQAAVESFELSIAQHHQALAEFVR